MSRNSQRTKSGAALAVTSRATRPASPDAAFTGYPPLAYFARSERDPHRRRMPIRRYLNLARRDPQLFLAAFLTLPVVLIELVVGGTPTREVVATGLAFLAIQVAWTGTRFRSWSAARLALSLAFVLLVNAHEVSHGTAVIAAFQIPIVALAAAIGSPGTIAVAIIGFLTTIGPVGLSDLPIGIRQDALAMAATEVVLAIGSRRVVASMEQAVERTRAAHTRERRRARQFSAIEAVGRLLVREGPRGDALARVMDILEGTFGFRYPSVYLWDGSVLRLGAHRNYANPIQEFDIARGVIGRVARTRLPAFVTDVSADPDYESADPAVNGEISIPLLDGDALLGVLNIESSHSRLLDAEDFATMQVVGDRLAAALALGHERLKLAARGELLAQLTTFSAGLNGSLDPATVHEFVASGAARVVDAQMVVLTLLDVGTGEFHAVAIEGGDPHLVGIRILPGEGTTGRSIQDHRLTVDDHLDRARFPQAAGSATVPDVVATMAVPLMRDGEAFGAVLWLRGDLSRPYSTEEQEVAALLGVQVSLALVNLGLLNEAREAAITDPLTGLHNRRFFDASMEQLLALRARDGEKVRQPMSAIMFDLDHFGLINKRHGHQVGDQILRAFADVLRSRVRASDLVARFGGEEFIVVLPGANREQAARLADDVREAFAAVRTTAPSGEMIGCTVSAGCAELGAAQQGGSILIEHADVALAMAKAAGRNQVVTA